LETGEAVCDERTEEGRAAAVIPEAVRRLQHRVTAFAATGTTSHA
jgi:hypothetical protein